MKKLLILSFLFSSFTFLHAQQISISNPELLPIKLEKISPALRDAPEIKEDESGKIRLEHENPSLEHPIPIKNPDALPQGTDPAIQTNYSSPYSDFTNANILSTWPGMSAAVDPSDNTLAVGPNHVMQMTNNNSSTYIRIWDKAGNILVDKKKVSTITGINDFGDPNILYDEIAKRFVFIVLYSFSASKLVVCVSQTSDPTGAYYVYSFTTTGGFPDYPKIAMWKNSYFITTNSNSPSIFVLKRNALLKGQPLGTVQSFTLADFPSLGFQTASPVMQTGLLKPKDASPALIMRVGDDAWGGSVGSDHLEIFELKINWTNPANSTMTGPTNLNTIAYNSNLCGFNSFNCIPQPGTSTKLDPLGTILMDKVQYRNLGSYESIVCSHVCNADGLGNAGIRWYELRKDGSGDWFIYQQSTYFPSTYGRFVSSMSINQSGQIALGYNISSSTVFPGIRITGRDSCDALNTMTVPETIIQSGTSKNGSNRYGDYNAMVTDPTDGSFWFTANYNVTTDWSTSVVHFTLDPCQLRVSTQQNAINELKVVPNPASNEVEISFMSNVEEEVPLQIVDMTGNTILKRKQQVVAGFNNTKLDIHNLQNGYYIVKVLSSGGEAFQKLVIQR